MHGSWACRGGFGALVSSSAKKNNDILKYNSEKMADDMEMFDVISKVVHGDCSEGEIA